MKEYSCFILAESPWHLSHNPPQTVPLLSPVQYTSFIQPIDLSFLLNSFILINCLHTFAFFIFHIFFCVCHVIHLASVQCSRVLTKFTCVQLHLAFYCTFSSSHFEIQAFQVDLNAALAPNIFCLSSYSSFFFILWLVHWPLNNMNVLGLTITICNSLWLLYKTKVGRLNVL